MASRKKKKAQPEIEGLRSRIDDVDRRLHALINERARLARQVGVSKGKEGRLVDFYRPEREAQVLRMALERNAASRASGALRDEEVVRLFREIMSACLAQEEPLKIGFLGPEGTFSQTAVYKHFGHSARALALSTIDEVFHEVEAGHADFGVVPIENSTEGSVNHTLDRFLVSPLRICGEVELRIRQNLMGKMRSLREVKRICSHPQSLAQCRQWLQEHLPDVEIIAESSNAEAARRARDEKGTAAIAGETASEVYGLTILAADIEDRADNSTRFLVIGRRTFGRSGRDRTTLLVSTGHTEAPGALYRLLEPLAKNRVSLTRIESRPSQRRKWDYVFFIDLEGHIDDAPVARALERLKSRASLYRVLGSYPRAVL
ncbi:MAG: prephenate dehydratase [Gammaproteobacteria bacterium]|jgi:chorismate mutase / prephenate dehydratase|nr:prephenate dehydratase [Gammaproteobacteria bacterium]NBP07717.1 prephenate dehydratase [Gammaproteobacteria bacterium]NCW21688.1 prephenate dehydratase [Gammaproteobacteria bacterium]NCW57438.1 prephenate dehydratase [Gammaproteobacteria bacterium]NDE87093.1 prephenate dehydratase [Gammaproteobacteria bacterium]